MGNISKIYCNPPTVCGICSTLCLTSSAWTTARNSPVCHPAGFSAITHTLETEFMPVAVNKGLSLSVKTGHDAIVLTDKERIIQIGNNLLSNAVKFTEEGGVSLITEYDMEF